MKAHSRIPSLFLASAVLAFAGTAYAQSAPLPAELSASLPLSSSSSSSSSAMLEEAAPAAAQATPASMHSDSGSSRPFSSVGVGVKVGLEGIGFDAAVPIVPGTLNVRGGAGFFSYNHSFTESGDTINGTLKLNNAEIMADWFPFHGGFRLSAGLTVYNNTAVNGTLTFPGGTNFTVGNSKYTSDPNDPTTGVAALKFGGNTVPRFTIGWGNMVPKSGHRLRFETELGIEYINNPSVVWTLTGDACTTTSTSQGVQCSSEGYGPVAASDIAQENANIQSDINDLKVFPVVQIGLSYKIGH
jgi:hypothetical protein